MPESDPMTPAAAGGSSAGGGERVGGDGGAGGGNGGGGRDPNILGEPGDVLKAADATISLSQAVLAPLDAVLQAQLHSARSFLNLLLQLGYPHIAVDENGEPKPQAPGAARGDPPYTMDFVNEVTIDGVKRRQIVTVPALALVPVTPLAVQSAEFSFELSVVEVGRLRQIQASEEKTIALEKKRTSELKEQGKRPAAEFDEARRPWYLVEQPVSIRGAIAPPAALEERSGERAKSTTIRVNVKVGAAPVPAGLTRLLTGLTQMSSISTEAPRNGAKPTAPQTDAAPT